PEAEEEAKLLHVHLEVDVIRQLQAQVAIVGGEGCTRDTALEGLKDTPWVHFVCHDHQNLTDPFQSHFSLLMRDAPLTILNILKNSLHDAELAFLSACHSAAGDRSAPDESIHLTAGLMFAGFRSVVGTMWGMGDVDGPVLAEEFCKCMFRREPIRWTVAMRLRCYQRLFGS
ncbi:hypothetical protein FRB97_008783, partial [Tulasnella sp. 331]